jgi:ABC-type phosphate transport system substrate-binding protein
MPVARPIPATLAARSSSQRTLSWRAAMVVLVVGLVGVGAAAQRYKVIVNPKVAVSNLSRAEVSQFFMKKVTKWRDGAPVVPIDQTLGSDVREAFSHDVHGRGASAVDAYWQKQIFSGRDVPPVTKANDGDVTAYVRANAGAIGYVSATADTSGVKVLEVE